jgi:hypothetical protein
LETYAACKASGFAKGSKASQHQWEHPDEAWHNVFEGIASIVDQRRELMEELDEIFLKMLNLSMTPIRKIRNIK